MLFCHLLAEITKAEYDQNNPEIEESVDAKLYAAKPY